MPDARLDWKLEGSGYRFTLHDRSGRRLPVEEWGHHTAETARGLGSSAALVAALEDGEARRAPDGAGIEIDHDTFARFPETVVRQVGLPPVAPYRLRIEGKGVLSQPGFAFNWRLIAPTGRPAMGVKRQGTHVQQGSNEYTLVDPLYSLVTGMEAYNALPSEDMDARFLKWAELKELLPEDAEVSDHLRTMNIVQASSLSLDPHGSADFDPVLLSGLSKEGSEEAPASDEPGPILPDRPQSHFAERFRQLPRAHQHYALPGNWYVVVPEQVRKGLEVVHEIQRAPQSERAAFLANPQSTLRERLGGELSESELEQLFQETPQFVSERVRYLGQWMPKARAFNVPSEQQWFPEEGVVLGVPTPNGMYQVPPADTSAVLEKLREAREAGQPTISFQGQEIPADDETVQAFEQVVPERAPKEPPEPPEPPPGSDKPAPEAPVIVDNLEELEYSAAPRKTAGAPGGLPAALGSLRLFPHQQVGLEWLQKHWTSGSRGALLADDMGLGKTLQALAFMAWVQEQMEDGYHPQKPLLVVAPTGLLRNWEAEAERHLEAGGLGPVLRAYGSGISTLSSASHRERRRQLAESGWVLTTYETLRDKFHLFLDLEWAVVVFDEVQKIKNPGARATDIAKSVAGDFAVALTGTPVENSLTELWCIVDTISPGYLGALREFREKYEHPARENPEVAGQVKELLEAEDPPKLLRRMKEDHLPDLPPHETHLLERNMSPTQSQAYRAALQSAVAGQGQKGSALQALQQMRRVSLLPAELPPEGITDEYVGESARLQAAIEVLDDVHARGERALVFLEYLDVQAALLDYLQRRYAMPSPPLRISGQLDASRRQQHVDVFQGTPDGRFQVMLLSPKAGGVGLTLTAANHVIHLTRWWNPAVEDQCTDRALRIGQEREVHIYYPVAVDPEYREHSFDLNLHRLLTRKRKLSRAALAPVSMSDGDSRELLSESLGQGQHS